MDSISTQMNETITRLENLFLEIDGLEASIAETDEKIDSWRDSLSQKAPHLTSQCEELRRELADHQENLGALSNEVEVGLSEVGEGLGSQAQEIRREADSLKESLFALKNDFREFDAKLDAQFDEIEKDFHSLQQQISENQKALEDEMNEVEHLLETEFKQVQDEAREEIADRGDALKEQILAHFAPALADQSEKLAAHLQDMLHRVEAKFRQSEDRTREEIGQSLHFSHDLSLREMDRLAGETQQFARNIEDLKNSLVKTGREINDLMNGLSDVSQKAKGPLGNVARILKLLHEELDS